MTGWEDDDVDIEVELDNVLGDHVCLQEKSKETEADGWDGESDISNMDAEIDVPQNSLAAISTFNPNELKGDYNDNSNCTYESGALADFDFSAVKSKDFVNTKNDGWDADEELNLSSTNSNNDNNFMAALKDEQPPKSFENTKEEGWETDDIQLGDKSSLIHNHVEQVAKVDDSLVTKIESVQANTVYDNRSIENNDAQGDWENDNVEIDLGNSLSSISGTFAEKADDIRVADIPADIEQKHENLESEPKIVEDNDSKFESRKIPEVSNDLAENNMSDADNIQDSYGWENDTVDHLLDNLTLDPSTGPSFISDEQSSDSDTGVNIIEVADDVKVDSPILAVSELIKDEYLHESNEYPEENLKNEEEVEESENDKSSPPLEVKNTIAQFGDVLEELQAPLMEIDAIKQLKQDPVDFMGLISPLKEIALESPQIMGAESKDVISPDSPLEDAEEVSDLVSTACRVNVEQPPQFISEGGWDDDEIKLETTDKAGIDLLKSISETDQVIAGGHQSEADSSVSEEDRVEIETLGLKPSAEGFGWELDDIDVDVSEDAGDELEKSKESSRVSSDAEELMQAVESSPEFINHLPVAENGRKNEDPLAEGHDISGQADLFADENQNLEIDSADIAQPVIDNNEQVSEQQNVWDSENLEIPKNSAEQPEHAAQQQATSPKSWLDGVFSSIQEIGSEITTKTVVDLENVDYESKRASSGGSFKHLLDRIAPKTQTIAVEEGSQSESESIRFKSLFDKLSSFQPQNMPVEITMSSSPAVESVDEKQNFKGLFDNFGNTQGDRETEVKSLTSPILNNPLISGGISVLGKIGSSTFEMANQKFKPTVSDFASIVKEKMNVVHEMPKLTLSKLKLDAKSMLYGMDEAIELIEAIQVKACHSSILLKRKKRQENHAKIHARLESFRDDPLVSVSLTDHSLLLDDAFWNQIDMEGIDELRLKFQELLLLAPNPVDSILESFCNLANAPELLSADLFKSLFAYTYRHEIARFTFLALSLMTSLIKQENSRFLTGNADIQLRTLISTLLADLQWMSKQSCRIDENLTISFPELKLKDCIEIVDLVSMELSSELKDCMVVIREAFYAFEPIIQARQLIQ